MKLHYICGKCKNPISFGILRFSSKITCSKCGKEYMIYKDVKWQMAEMFILITIVLTLKEKVENLVASLPLRILILCVFGLVFNFIYDMILGLILKERYFSVEEKLTTSYRQKKNSNK